MSKAKSTNKRRMNAGSEQSKPFPNYLFVKGTCNDMCSESERSLQRERLLHRLEFKTGGNPKHPETDISLTIKRYSRPAAGQKPPLPSDIRTPKALTYTINYMMREIITKSDVDWTVIYDFVFDRLRAVRQDMVMQGLHGFTCIAMLEVIVRFHAYAGYRLCEMPLSRYDPSINKTHLRECLTRLLVLYEEENTFFENRSEMEALNLTENLGISPVLNRAFGLAKMWRTPVVNLAMEMSLAALLGNYRRICRMLPQLPPLLVCSASLHLPEIRSRALQVMSNAYSSTRGTFPVSKLRDVLLFETDKRVLKECLLHNICCKHQETNHVVIFNKTSFNPATKASSPFHFAAAEEVINSRNLESLICGL